MKKGAMLMALFYLYPLSPKSLPAGRQGEVFMNNNQISPLKVLGGPKNSLLTVMLNSALYIYLSDKLYIFGAY
jgi:hypothetical protein